MMTDILKQGNISSFRNDIAMNNVIKIVYRCDRFNVFVHWLHDNGL